MPATAGTRRRLDSGLAIDRSRASDNHGPRAGHPGWPDCIVLHYTGMRDGPAAVDWLCNPVSEVSCHYVVTEAGGILQLVPEERRAWHAGRASWAGVTDINSASIGIEVVNVGHDFGLPDYPAPQIDAVLALCTDIAARHGIRPERVLGHSDIAPARKRDPGEHFPWWALAEAGVAHWVPAAPDRDGPDLALGEQGAAVTALQHALARYGYGLSPTGIFDAATETVVRAFQRRFRPSRVDGRADAGTLDTLARLMATISAA